MCTYTVRTLFTFTWVCNHAIHYAKESTSVHCVLYIRTYVHTCSQTCILIRKWRESTTTCFGSPRVGTSSIKGVLNSEYGLHYLSAPASVCWFSNDFWPLPSAIHTFQGSMPLLIPYFVQYILLVSTHMLQLNTSNPLPLYVCMYVCCDPIIIQSIHMYVVTANGLHYYTSHRVEYVQISKDISAM